MATRETQVGEADVVALLEAAQAQLDQAERLRIRRIEEARALGVTWERIGAALGMSGEGARRAFLRSRPDPAG